jgi:hypothetical protein
MPAPHEHRFDLQLGADGRGQLYGNYEGYVKRCKCGEYAPDYVAYIERRKNEIREMVRGWDGAGSNVDGVDYETNRG